MLRKINSIPKKKKNYSYNSHLLNNNIFNSFDNYSTIDVKIDKINIPKLDRNQQKFEKLDSKYILSTNNDSFTNPKINRSEIMIKDEELIKNNIMLTEYSEIKKQPCFYKLNNNQNRPNSGKYSLPPLDMNKLQVINPSIIKNM